jgi:acetyl esterase/lipase
VELLEVILVSRLDFDMVLHVCHAPLEVKASLSAHFVWGVLRVRCMGRSAGGHLVLLHLLIAELLVILKVIEHVFFRVKVN